MRDNMLLGVGMNLFFFQDAFTLKTNPKEIQFENNDAIYYLSDSKKTSSLIGGVTNPRKV